MDEKSVSSSRLAPRTLPWLVALAALVLYLATVCRWLNPLNLETVGQVSGWLWQLPYQNPLLYLVCLPLRVLPDSLYPMGLNVLASVFAAATLGQLVRTLLLLPYDRTHEGRIRGHVDETSLHIKFSWVPPVFGAAILGLQLSFWEHATAMTGDMLDLFVFAYCIRCLMEYRLDVRESWLWRMALAYGVGVTNNWAMIGFAPLFLVAMIWIRGFSFFNFGFLLRLTGFGALGLLLYLVMPLTVLVTKRVDSGFFETLYSILIAQKTILLGMPRVKALVLSLICVVPVVAMGIRWAGSKGSSVERAIALGAVYSLKLAWLVACTVIMFDLPFSPREMVQKEIGLAMLTFYYLAAMVAGYFLGLFLLVLGSAPDRMHGPPGPMPAVFGRALYGLLLLGAVVAPAALVYRNLPKARDTGALSDYAHELLRAVPKEPSVLVADHMTYLWLAEAERRRTPNAPEHLLILTSDAKRKDYQAYLDRRYGTAWPGLKRFTGAQTGILLEFLSFLADNGKNGRAFYLQHSFGMFFEVVQMRPRGLVNLIQWYPQGQLLAPPLTEEEAQQNVALWQQAETSLLRHQKEERFANIAPFPARAANYVGVELQRAGRLDEAKRLFELAEKLVPSNPTAAENLKVNEQLRAGKKPALDAARVKSLGLTPTTAMSTVTLFGPTEDPAGLLVFGRNCLESPEELRRQALASLKRLNELVPGEFLPTMLLGAAYLKLGLPDETLNRIKEIREIHRRQALSPDDFAEMISLHSLAMQMKGDRDGALRLVQEAKTSQSDNVRVLDTLVNLLIDRGNFEEASRVVVEWVRLKPNDPIGLFRRAQIQMQTSQFALAAEGFSAVLKKDPANRVALMNRAICYLKLKQLDESRRDYARLAEEFPDRPQIQFGLGEVAVLQKRIPQAIEHFERYLEYAPRTEEYTNVLQRLEELKKRR